MEIWQMIAFAVFFACCLAQFWFIARVRNALIDRHSEAFLQIERSSIFPLGGFYRFICSSRHHDLRDAGLTRAVINMRWLFLVAIAAWLVFAAGIFVAPLD
jgi:hypothetical protein